MIRENHKELVTTLKDYMFLANELKEYDLLASKSRFLIQQYIMKGENQKALQLCDSILLFKPYFKKQKSEAYIILKRGGIYFSELAYDKAIKDYKESASLFLKSKDSIFAADAFLFSGQAYSNTGKFVKAINSFEKANSIYEQLKDYTYMFRTAKELDLIYRRNGLRKLANKQMPKLISKAKKYKSYGTLQFLYLSLSEEAIKDFKLKLANTYLDSSKQYERFISDLVIRSNNKLQSKKIELRLWLKQNNIKVADSIYAQLLSLEKKIKYKRLTFLNIPEKAAYLLRKGERKKALKLLLDYKNYAIENSLNSLSLLESERLLSALYEKYGDFKNALKHNTNYLELKDSINKASLTGALAFHQTKFETAQKEKEILKQEIAIKQFEKEQQLVKSKRTTTLVILFSIILIIFGIWWREKNKRIHLKKELRRNKDELIGFTNQLLLKRKEQEELKLQLEKLKVKVVEKETINSIQDLVTSKILTKDDWYIFKEKFIRVHPNFFIEINGKGYKLTKSEERLVALEKLGLDNNEIANMLGVSVDSIFISRYRLRKKISAPKEIPLIEYLS
ncbi:hypothetical protein [uncultured Tenacibaculum sp.]|uniref:hypothetical protein n=1 Tax=uncultured Tenacibaculum sp. TaxID=174713 RepID=UPI002627CDBE|nr:hypothetical protein [uncultured Tenacibaculum sp.]